MHMVNGQDRQAVQGTSRVKPWSQVLNVIFSLLLILLLLLLLLLLLSLLLLLLLLLLCKARKQADAADL